MAEPGWWQRWLGSMRVRIVAVVVVLLLVSSIGSVLVMRAVLLARLDDQVRVDLAQEAQEFRLLSTGRDPRTGEPFAGDLQAIFDVYFSREVPDEGESLLAFVDGRLYESRRAVSAAEPGQLARAIEYWLSLRRPERGVINTPLGEARYVALPRRGRGEDGLFVVANFPAFERGEIDEAVRTELGVQVAALLLASLLALALAGRVLRPLRTLASTARSISDTDLTRRIPVSGKDEASLIAEAFNDMLTRLERAFSVQREFLDDTSHELRSPLTVIRGHVEMLEFDLTPEERAESIALVSDEIERMTQIVHDLALLARAEQPNFLQLGPVDLRELVTTVEHKVTVLGERSWRLQAPQATVILADRHRLTQALMQLVDNAVKFTKKGTVIGIGAAVEDRVVRLWVDDAGVGVSPEDAERIFARFGRGSSTETDPRGSGLGLSIVGAIAQAHGGRVRLVPRSGAGARFEILIPYTAPAADRHPAGPSHR